MTGPKKVELGRLNPYKEGTLPMTQPYGPTPDPQYPHHSVSKSRKKTSHTFHLLMCLFTCGL